MKNECVVVAAVFVIAGVAGCSLGTDSADPELEQLSPGTAQLTINGKDAGRTEAVDCVLNKHLTTITVEDGSHVAVAMVSNIDELAVEWVRFHDVNGFTGSYNDGLGGDAHITLDGSTYQISGIAGGFNNQNSSQPSVEAFTIEVSC